MANIISSTQKKVRSFLKTIYGPNYKHIVQELEEVFIVQRGSAAVHVSVKPLSKDDCIVQALAYVVSGAKIGPKLLTYLMRLNANAPIGAFGMLFDDTINFSHSITGANLNANELRTTIGTVAFVADETDDEIRRIAGGMRAVDANAVIMGDGEVAPAPLKSEKKPAAKKASAVKPAAKKPAPAKKAAPVKKVAPKKKS